MKSDKLGVQKFTDDGAAQVVEGSLNSWLDETSSLTYTYYCEWPPNQPTSEANGRVCRYEIATKTSLWAKGSREMTCVVDDRANLDYGV